jgi:hypothetical protein
MRSNEYITVDEIQVHKVMGSRTLSAHCPGYTWSPLTCYTTLAALKAHSPFQVFLLRAVGLLTIHMRIHPLLDSLPPCNDFRVQLRRVCLVNFVPSGAVEQWSSGAVRWSSEIEQ